MARQPDVTLAQLQRVVTGMPGLEQGLEKKKSALSKQRSALKTASEKADPSNKRWFDAWSGNFPAGSADWPPCRRSTPGRTRPRPARW